MMRITTLILLCIIFSYHSASADFYKYIDQDGNVRYTDDFSKVPKSQRSNVTSYEESASESRPSASSERMEPRQLTPKDTPEADGALDEERKQINQRQEALIKEYKALMEEKERIAQASKRKLNINESVELDRDTDKLKEKIQQYDQKRKALNDEIEAYNNRMSKKKDGNKQ